MADTSPPTDDIGSPLPVKKRQGLATISGRPNVGKSTLLNRLLGRKTSIVSHRRQTTRAVCHAADIYDDAEILWLDTPGWQTKHGGGINRALNTGAERAAASADVVVFVIAAAWTPADHAFLERIPAELPLIGALNKIDLIADKEQLLPALENLSRLRDFHALVPLSAKTGNGLDALRQEVAALMPWRQVTQTLPQAAIAGADNTEEETKFFFAELLREKIFRAMEAELPYHIGVITDSIVREKHVWKVDAQIFVEKESQKRIIIGKDGEMMKRLATQARIDMEKFSRSPVFLTVRVRIADWRHNTALLKQMRISVNK